MEKGREKEAENCGRAYAFMDFEASKKQIEYELPKARKAAGTPSRLEISVREVKELIEDRTTDPELVRCISQNSICPLVPKGYDGPTSKTESRRMSDLKYVLEAKYSNATNKQASEEITDVTSFLGYTFSKDKPFYSLIISKDPNGQYRPWTND